MPSKRNRASGHERFVAHVHHLYNLAEAQRTPRQAFLSAFEALVFVGGYWRFESPQKKADPNWEPAPEGLVTVPWWIVDFLAQAWIAYRGAPRGKTFGEILGIEGGGQGKRPAKESWLNYHRDLLLALNVHRTRVEADQKGERLSLEKAWEIVAESEHSTEEIVRRAWKKHGRKLTEAQNMGA